MVIYFILFFFISIFDNCENSILFIFIYDIRGRFYECLMLDFFLSANLAHVTYKNI